MFPSKATKALPPAPERVRFNPTKSHAARLTANLAHQAALENARITDATIAPSSPKFIAGRNRLKNREPTPHGDVFKANDAKKRDATNRAPLADKDVRSTKKATGNEVPKASECRNLLQVFSQPMTQEHTKIGKQPEKENVLIPDKPKLKRKPPQPEKKVPPEMEPDCLVEEMLKRPNSMTEKEIIESMGDERQHRKERASVSPAFHESFDSAEFDHKQDVLAEKESDSKADCVSQATTVSPGCEVDLNAVPLKHGMTEEEMMAHLEEVGKRDGVGDKCARQFCHWGDRKPKNASPVFPPDSPDTECEIQRWETEREHDEFLRQFHEDEMSKKNDEEHKEIVEKEQEQEQARILNKGAQMHLKIGVDSLVAAGADAGKKAPSSDSQAEPKKTTDPFQFIRGISRQPFKSKANITFVDGAQKGMSDKPKEAPPNRNVEGLVPKPRRTLTEEEEEKRQKRIERVHNRGNLITKEAISSRDLLVQSMAGHTAREVKAKMKCMPRENPESIEVLLGGAPPETKARKEAFKDPLLTAVQKKRKNDAAAAARQERKAAAEKAGADHGGGGNAKASAAVSKKGGKKSKGAPVKNTTTG